MIAQIAASLIFLASLWLILTEKLNRTITSIAGAVLMLGMGMILGVYTEAMAIEAIDFNTLGLLLGMMILVALLEPTGFFQYLAVWAGRLSRGRPVRLLLLLAIVTTLLSMFLDNVTTVVLIAPVTILICEILGISPIPYLTAEALLSNTGGVATLVGDPPNILIGSAAGFSFNDFLTHSLPIVVVAWFAALMLLIYLFRNELNVNLSNADAVLQLDPAETLDDRKMAQKIIIVLCGAILLFFVHGRVGISPAFIAVGATAVALVWVQPDLQDMFRRIEWSVLAFFSALFVMVGGLEATGVLDFAVSALERFNDIPLVLYGMIMIWLVAGLSAIVDNVPITIALIPVLQGLDEAGLNIQPLWWALVFGAGFGGNGTIIGSTANIVVVSLSERTRAPITSSIWNKRGLPVMLVTCLVATILYALAFPILNR